MAQGSCPGVRALLIFRCHTVLMVWLCVWKRHFEENRKQNSLLREKGLLKSKNGQNCLEKKLRTRFFHRIWPLTFQTKLQVPVLPMNGLHWLFGMKANCYFLLRWRKLEFQCLVSGVNYLIIGWGFCNIQNRPRLIPKASSLIIRISFT